MMGKNVKIKGLDSLMKKLSDPQKLSKDIVNQNGGIEIKCPNCHNKIKVPTSGITCKCGQKINFELK
ncbi:MAG: hypothetical protein LKF42_09785 [Streptococcaceae bacterium]|jgi:DNA-directed RNA polymerase subunit RPC12/RpoP|nr:hypothetical protein [Streptococcaceae bacterium]